MKTNNNSTKMNQTSKILVLILCSLPCFTMSSRTFENQLGSINFQTENLNDLTVDFHDQSVQLCKRYDNNFVCLRCVRDYYLINQVCTKIDFSNLITGCNVYISATVCDQCDALLYFNAATVKCEAADSIANCKLFTGKSTCSVCNAGFALTGNACVSLNNCVNVKNGVCVTCNTGYYLSNSQCVAVTITIVNCRAYSSTSFCQQCASGFVLSSDNKLCMDSTLFGDSFDPNCDDLIDNSGKVCDLCREGYNLRNDGKCVNFDKSEICFLPNVVDLSKCEYCFTGYSMKTYGSCIVSEIGSSNQVDPITNKHASIFNFVSIFILAVIVKK